jgi:hypothetical protein
MIRKEFDMSPWMQNLPVAFFMAILILVFFLIDVHVKKLRSIGKSSVIAFGLFVVSIVVICIPAFLTINVIKMLSHIISFSANWPAVVVFKILNLKQISISSYPLIMLIEISKFVINTFVIFGVIKLISYIKYKRSAKKL